MKFKVEQEELLRALNAISKVCGKDDPFRFVVIKKLNDKALRLIGGDGVLYIQYDIQANNIDGENICYDIFVLTAIVSKLAGAIEFNDGIIKSQKSKFKIGFGTSALSDINFNQNESIKVNYNELKIALINTSYAAEHINKSVISGIYFNNNNVVATDGNRLVINKINADLNNFVLPNIASHINKLFLDEEVIINTDNNNIYISDSNITLKTPKIIGNYPKYEQLLPKQHEYKIVFDKNEMIDAINIVTPISLQNPKNIIDLVINRDILTIKSTVNSDEGITDFNLKESNIEDLTISLNGNYLIELLKTCKDDETILEINGTTSPLVFKNNDTYCLIMPIVKKY